ncbi:DNA-directed RNA polymerase subunit epsilon [Loigolactobacillus zhaoyuanensis]|uniref:DNA-directed RNA polymerase subunit epsilon n=1 Tax=Loigolactobacillus zhaoyuanensis TaxID=2486017 RepID=A0ABW8U916_9LACO|nr:DNA-directed RNA polymerase subunit epsilon [Loigolactobacillus zhaoyuanensis]
MIFKVLYQENKAMSPRRESTKTLYMDTTDAVTARAIIETQTPYNVEYIQELIGNHLEYEQKSPEFKLTEFNNEETERQE